MLQKDWIKYYDKLPSGCSDCDPQIVQTWDLSPYDKSMCMLWGKRKNEYYLIDIIFNKAIGFGELRETIMQLAYDYKADLILLEDISFTYYLKEDLIKHSKLPFIRCGRMAEKIERFIFIASLFQDGKVHMPKEGSKDVVTFYHELMNMPYPGDNINFLNAAYRFLRWAHEKDTMPIPRRKRLIW